MPESLSLLDRYRALADGKALQILETNGGWIDFDPGHHPLMLANEWRVKPDTASGYGYYTDSAIISELQSLIAHCGVSPSDTLAGLLSQLSYIISGYTLQKQRLLAFEQGVLVDLTPDQLLRVGQAANVLLVDYEKGKRFQDIRLKVEAWDSAQPHYARAQELCTRLKLGPLGGDLIDILCSRVEADEKEKVEAAHSDASARIDLRRALVHLINACGGPRAIGLETNAALVEKAEAAAMTGGAKAVKELVDLRVAIIKLITAAGGHATAADSNDALAKAAIATASSVAASTRFVAAVTTATRALEEQS